MSQGGLAVLSAAREDQIPLLSAMLLGGCAAKAHRAIRAWSIAEGLSPTAMFPLRLHRPVTMAMCMSELALGAGLLLTAGRAGAGLPATTVRAATALLFLTAVGALHELRGRRPRAGCGCFGDLSDTPVGLRTLTRSALLCAAAVAAIGAPPLRKPATSAQAGVLLAVLAAEMVVIAALSPEFGEILVRLGYSEPCEVRRLPVSRTLSALRASSAWRRYRSQLIASQPVDVWREGCWRYVVYPGIATGRPVDVIFAVYLQARRPPIRAAVLEAAPGEVIAGAVPGVPGAQDPVLAGSGSLAQFPGSRWPAGSRASQEGAEPPAAGVPRQAVPLAAPAGHSTRAAHHAADSRADRRPAGIARSVHGHSGRRARHSSSF